MNDHLEKIARDAEQALAHERVLRSSANANRQQLLAQASERADRLRQQRDALRQKIQDRRAKREDKQTYRTLCLEVATLDKLVGRYS